MQVRIFREDDCEWDRCHEHAILAVEVKLEDNTVLRVDRLGHVKATPHGGTMSFSGALDEFVYSWQARRRFSQEETHGAVTYRTDPPT